MTLWRTLLSLVFVFFWSEAIASDKSLALVIGVQDYEFLTPLTQTSGDARAVGKLFARNGYEVTYASKITSSQQMIKVIDEFAKSVKLAARNGDVKVALYYSGHGLESAGSNWLLGPDFNPRSVSTIDNQEIFKKFGVDLKVVANRLKSARVKSTVFILDACRTPDIMIRGGKILRPGFDTRNFGSLTEFVMLYAAATGSVAYATPSGNQHMVNSVFTHYFLENAEKISNIADLADRIQDQVKIATIGKEVPQHPSYYDGYSGAYSLFDSNITPGIPQSGPVIRIFYNDRRQSQARQLASVLEQNGLYYSLVPDDFADLKTRRLDGANRVVAQNGITRGDRQRLNRVEGFLKLMDTRAPGITYLPDEKILAKPFQVQLF